MTKFSHDMSSISRKLSFETVPKVQILLFHLQGGAVVKFIHEIESNSQ